MYNKLDFTTHSTEINDDDKLKDCTLKLVSFVQRMRYATNYINQKNSKDKDTIVGDVGGTELEGTIKEGQDNFSKINLDLTKGYYINSIFDDRSC